MASRIGRGYNQAMNSNNEFKAILIFYAFVTLLVGGLAASLSIPQIGRLTTGQIFFFAGLIAWFMLPYRSNLIAAVAKAAKLDLL